MDINNRFDEIARRYQMTNVKADKMYSILPTVLKLLGSVSDKTVLDLGCGDGFFTLPIARQGAELVIGLDKSGEQIAAAQRKAKANTEFFVGDVFHDELPRSDVALAAFVPNYAENPEELFRFFTRVFESVRGGAVFVVDLPEITGGVGWRKRIQWGAQKLFSGGVGIEGSLIQNCLYAQGKHVCTLWARYYSQSCIQFALQNAGFHDIRWHKPIISEEGMELYGAEFWDGYINHPELGYITAKK